MDMVRKAWLRLKASQNPEAMLWYQDTMLGEGMFPSEGLARLVLRCSSHWAQRTKRDANALTATRRSDMCICSGRFSISPNIHHLQRARSTLEQDGRLTNRDGSRLELYRTPFVGEFSLGAVEIEGTPGRNEHPKPGSRKNVKSTSMKCLAFYMFS